MTLTLLGQAGRMDDLNSTIASDFTIKNYQAQFVSLAEQRYKLWHFTYAPHRGKNVLLHHVLIYG